VIQQRAALLVLTALATAAAFPGVPHVTVAAFGRRLLNFRVCFTTNKDSRACEIKPQQKRGHRI
jgi:hypothetical protein